MKKRDRFFTFSILTGILIIFLGILLYASTLEQNTLEEETLSYIRESNEYSEDEIKEIYVVNVGDEERKYSAVVHFKDEPDKAYFFIFEEDTDQIVLLEDLKLESDQ